MGSAPRSTRFPSCSVSLDSVGDWGESPDYSLPIRVANGRRRTQSDCRSVREARSLLGEEGRPRPCCAGAANRPAPASDRPARARRSTGSRRHLAGRRSPVGPSGGHEADPPLPRRPRVHRRGRRPLRLRARRRDERAGRVELVARHPRPDRSSRMQAIPKGVAAASPNSRPSGRSKALCAAPVPPRAATCGPGKAPRRLCHSAPRGEALGVGNAGLVASASSSAA